MTSHKSLACAGRAHEQRRALGLAALLIARRDLLQVGGDELHLARRRHYIHLEPRASETRAVFRDVS